MTSTTKITRNAILAALAVATIVPFVTADDADARGRRGGGDSFVEKDFVVPRGVKGYTGFIPGGAYCDYVRRPIRKCTYTRSGREICRVTGWNLTQACYR
ncbi:MAG: hypothetical protein RLZ98_2853 [Pseudomonadota bacterium]|jgi:hypothetical protein